MKTEDQRVAVRPLLEAHDLRVYFGGGKAPLKAVDGVSLAIARGETVGLVGESGCGKTTLGRALMRLEDSTGGRIVFDGVVMTGAAGRRLRTFRRRVQMIFQDPHGALNPRMSVGAALDEVLAVARGLPARERRRRTVELLEAVGLEGAYAGRYPHEFSGGQRQRIVIARALAVEPEVLIADEPVSALDVSVQVQILNLLRELRRRFNLAMLFIAHDLAVVRYMCERIMVMYYGRIVEEGPAEAVYSAPEHPYTRALLSAVPDLDASLEGRHRNRIILKGEVPTLGERITGCPFHPRCPWRRARCVGEEPALRETSAGRRVACHFAGELGDDAEPEREVK